MKKILLSLAATVSLAACDTWETTSLEPEEKIVEVSEATADAVTLPGSAFDASKYVNLGALEVTVNKTTAFHPSPTAEMVQDKLREDAAKLGATIVFDVNISETQISALSWGTRTGTGTAARPR